MSGIDPKHETHPAELKGGEHDHVERYSQDGAVDAESLGVNEKALLRKTDLRLVPWLALLYLLSFLDRSNIGNANLFGLSEHLSLDPNQYGACLAIFFAFYVAAEVPSNIVMKAWRPSMWLPIIMIAWGVVMTFMGIVRDYKGLLITRAFLGLAEAGLFPGWIFILEGILTVLVAVASFWMLSDYPETTKWLQPNERKFLQDRLLLDRDGTSHETKNVFVKHAFLDWKVWTFSIMYLGALTPLYCFSLFSPTLVAALGYTAATAQLMSVPPYAVAAVVTIGVGFLSDRLQRRGLLVAIFSAMSAIGYLMLLVTPNTKVQYAGLFIASSGCYPLIPLIMSWQANCIGGSLKKSVSTAIIVSIGNAGGIISSFIFPRTDGPRFIKGHAICVALEALCAVLALIMVAYFAWANKKKEKHMIERGAPYTAEEKKELEDMGDHAPWFKYTL